MDIRSFVEMYSAAQLLDPRVPKLDNNGAAARAWCWILEGVPAEDARECLRRVYSSPQMLVLQPGHVLQAWEELKAEREAHLKKLRNTARYLRGDLHCDERELADKREQHAELLNQLPEHVKKGLRHDEINP